MNSTKSFDNVLLSIRSKFVLIIVLLASSFQLLSFYLKVVKSIYTDIFLITWNTPSLSSNIYSIKSVMTPVPTVRLPSLIVNRRPFSNGIGWCSVRLKLASSPGITNSFPSSRLIVDATSPVRTYIWGV